MSESDVQEIALCFGFEVRLSCKALDVPGTSPWSSNPAAQRPAHLKDENNKKGMRTI